MLIWQGAVSWAPLAAGQADMEGHGGTVRVRGMVTFVEEVLRTAVYASATEHYVYTTKYVPQCCGKAIGWIKGHGWERP